MEFSQIQTPQIIIVKLSFTTKTRFNRVVRPCLLFHFLHGLLCLIGGSGGPCWGGEATPPSNKGLIAGLIKGNQWFINPRNKAGYFLGGVASGGAARIPMIKGLDTGNLKMMQFLKGQGRVGAPNVRVPMVFSWCFLGILGDNLPINTHYIGLR